jgi:hypothetical protein
LVEWNFQLESGKEIHPKSVVFPLTSPYTPSKPYRVIGTGFFIAKPGIFLTARHCLYQDDDLKNGWEDLTAMLHHPVSPVWLAASNNTDVAIGQLDLGSCEECAKHRVMQMCSWDPEPKEIMIHWGCGLSEIELLETDGTIDKLSGQYNTTGYKSHFEEYHPTGISLAKWPCYQTAAEFLSGDSGGPVTNSIGRVCAINSSSSEGGGYSTSVLVRDILDATVPRHFLVNDEPRNNDVTFREVFNSFDAEILQGAEELSAQ